MSAVQGDVFLRVRNFGPLEEGTSSLPDGRLRIPKYTLFIGGQGTGKSTVAKLYSVFSCLEDVFSRGLFNTQSFTFEAFEEILLNRNLSPDYVSDKTELEYSGNAFSFRIEGRKIKVTKSSGSYDCHQVIYHPSERNIISAFDVPWEMRSLSETVYQLAVLFLKANMASGKEPRELWSGCRIEFDPETRKTYILDGSGKSRIPLSFASSGLQSAVPLLVVSDYVSSFACEHDGFNLIQIVENPEQNLHPLSQVEILKRLLTDTPENGKLLLTTHSPYIVSAVENYNLAWDMFMKSGTSVPGVEKKYLMRYEDTAAYLFSGGSVKSIMNDESRMIDGSSIDKCSDIINSEFDRILDSDVSCR